MPFVQNVKYSVLILLLSIGCYQYVTKWDEVRQIVSELKLKIQDKKFTSTADECPAVDFVHKRKVEIVQQQQEIIQEIPLIDKREQYKQVLEENCWTVENQTYPSKLNKLQAIVELLNQVHKGENSSFYYPEYFRKNLKKTFPNKLDFLSLKNKEHVYFATINGSIDYPNITFASWIYLKKQQQLSSERSEIRTFLSNRLFGNGITSDYWGFSIFLDKNNQFVFQYSNEYQTFNISTSIKLNYNQWYHVAISFTSIEEDHRILKNKPLFLKFIINGNNEFFYESQNFKRPQQTARFLRLGASLVKKGSMLEKHPETVDYFLEALIDQFYIFNKLITADQVIDWLIISQNLPFQYIAFVDFRRFKYMEVENKALQNFTKFPFDDLDIMVNKIGYQVKVQPQSFPIYALFTNLTHEQIFDAHLYDKANLTICPTNHHPNYKSDQELYEYGMRQFNQLKHKLKPNFIPIVVLCYKKAETLDESFESMMYAQEINETLFIVSQDGDFQNVTEVILKYKKHLNIIHLPHKNPIIESPQNYSETQIKEIYLTYNKMFTFKFAFEYLNVSAVLGSEDDLVYTQDFYQYAKYTNLKFIQDPQWRYKVGAVLLFNNKQLRGEDGENSLRFWTYSHFTPNGIILPKHFWPDFQNIVYCHWSVAVRYYFAYNLRKIWISPWQGRSKNIGFSWQDSVHKGSSRSARRHTDLLLKNETVQYYRADGTPRFAKVTQWEKDPTKWIKNV